MVKKDIEVKEGKVTKNTIWEGMVKEDIVSKGREGEERDSKCGKEW
jgi:hypothetical protein